MGFDWRAVLRLPLPVLLLGGAFWLRPSFHALHADLLTLLDYLPWLVAGVTAVLSWQFNRARFLILSLMLAGAYTLVQWRLQVSLTDPLALETFTGLSYALPIMLLGLVCLAERGIINGYGAFSLALVTGAGLFSGGFAPYLGEWFPQQLAWFSLRPVAAFVLPWASSGLFLTAAIISVIALFWRNTTFEAAVIATLAAVFVVLGWLHLEAISVAMFSAAALVQLIAIIRSSHDMAYRDELTGLLGRRAFNERMGSLGRMYSIAMLDVDHFKKFNDTHGHDVGDEVLRLVASRISRVGRGGLPFRYGGEEFCIVFPRKQAQDCIEALEDVRESIADYRMTLRNRGLRPSKGSEGARQRGGMATRFGPNTVAVTVSVGLAERSDADLEPEEVLKAADQQLYRAKRAGRNRLKY